MTHDECIPLSKFVGMTYEQLHKKDRCDGFYDWFCADKALPGKARRLSAVVRAIVKTKTKLFDPEKTYVFFKNNCPCTGGLYDDLRICDIESGNVLYNVCPRNTWYGNRPTVAFESKEGPDRWEFPLVFDSMKDVRAWFRDPSKFEAKAEDVKVETGHSRGWGYRYKTVNMHVCRPKEAK